MEQSTEQSTQSTPDHYVEALQRFRGDVRMMEQVLATMIERGAPRSEVHLGLMLDEYLAGRSLRKARAIIGQLDELGVRIDPSRQYAVAIATATSGSAAEAVEIIDRLMEDQRDPSPEQAPAVLDLMIGARRTPQAWSLFRRMRSRSQRPSPDAHLTLLIDAIQRRAAKDSVSVISSMQEAGHRIPDVRITPLVRMLVGIGQLERALEVLGTTERAAASGQCALPGDDAYGTVLHALAAKGRVDDVLAVAQRITASGVTLSSHHRNAVLAASIAAQDFEVAWAETERMWADACLPTGANLEGLLDLSLAAGNVARAAGVLDLLLVIGVPVTPQRSGAVLRAEMAADGLDRVLPVASTMLDQGLVFDRATARDLVERLVRSRRLDEARSWLARFRSAGTLTQGRSYGSLLTALVSAKRVDDAIALLEEMVTGRVRPEQADLARLVSGRIKAGDVAAAERILTAASSAGVHADEATLRELMWTLARRSDVAAVDRIIALLAASGIAPDERHEKARAWASGETPRRLEDAGSGAVANGAPVDVPLADGPTDASTDGPTDALATAVPPADAPQPDVPPHVPPVDASSDERG
jgi:pentatricopeptide repeat protein